MVLGVGGVRRAAFLRGGRDGVIGRAVRAGVLRGRALGDRTLEAMRQVERWGPPAVTLSFLTVGVQTVVNFAAGLGRMSVPRYLTGLVPGAMIWGTIWATIGMTASTRYSPVGQRESLGCSPSWSHWS